MSVSQIIRVSSDKYTSKVGEVITIEVPTSIISRPVKSIRLLEALIPNTFSNIPTTANKFSFTDASNTYMIALPQVSVNSTTILEILKNTLEAASDAGLTFTIVYSKCDGTYTFKADGAFTLNFNVADSAADLLGFNTTPPYVAVETPPASNIYITQNNRRGQLDSDRYINITSNLITGVDQGVVFLDGDLTPTSTNILASIPIQSSSAGATLFFSDSSSSPDINIQSSVLGRIVGTNTNSVRVVTFGLSLDSGNPVDLGGASWSARFLLKYN